jgi:hypothetical protein
MPAIKRAKKEDKKMAILGMRFADVIVGEKVLLVSRFGKKEVEVASVGSASFKTASGNTYSRKTGAPWGRPYSSTTIHKIANV